MSEQKQVPYEAGEPPSGEQARQQAEDPSGQQPSQQAGQPYQTGTGSSSTADSSWQEVGRQFQALGDSLAQTVCAALQNEETQRTMEEMRMGLESMVRKVGNAIDETANSEQGQQIRQDAEKAAAALRTAGEQTVQEVRPQLINALQQVNTELQKLINRMEQKNTAGYTEGNAAPVDENQDPQI